MTSTSTTNTDLSYLNTGKKFAIGPKGDIMPGVWTKPKLPLEKLDIIDKILPEIYTHRFTLHNVPIQEFKYLDLQLWEIPWRQVIATWKLEVIKITIVTMKLSCLAKSNRRVIIQFHVFK